MKRGRVMSAWQGGLIVAGLVGSMVGCESITDRFCAVQPGSEETVAPVVPGEQDVALSSLDERIAEAYQYVDAGYHLDPAPLTELIEEHHGDLESISYICEHFYWPAFCWRKASELNPDIREEICGRFVEDYAEEHVVDEEDVERSAYECLLGIPLFVH